MRKLALIFLLAFTTFLLSKTVTFAGESGNPTGIVEIVEVYQERDGKQCNFFDGCVVAGTDVQVHLSGIAYNNGLPLPEGSTVDMRIRGSGSCLGYPAIGWEHAELINDTAEFTIPGSKIRSGCSYELVIKLRASQSGESGDDKPETNKTIVASSIAAQAQCSAEECNEDLSMSSNYELCSQIKTDTTQYEECANCFGSGGVWTAIGCVPSNPESIIKVVVTIGLALGGGVVLVMILVGALMLSVSQGDPNKTKEAKEIITSAIIGLLFIIFSVTILQFIGVSILHIPGFGE